MGTFTQDVRYGFRMLVKNPGFTAVAVLTLALGIGANTAIFTLINAVLLKMLPIQDPGRLVVLGDPSAVGNRSLGTPQTDIFSAPLYRELRDGNSVFSGMYAAGSAHRVDMNDASQPGSGNVSSSVRIVSGNYFSVLGVNAVAGRTLTSDDDKAQHGHPVAVISYDCWKNRFALSPETIGKTVRLNHYPFTIIGVAPPGFFGDIVGENLDIFVPLAMQAELMRGRDWYQNRNASWLQIMGRLKPGASLEQARANLNVVYQQILAGSFGAALEPADLKAIQKRQIDVAPGGRGLSWVRSDYQKPLLLLMAMVGLILLIACVNVANLLLARASGRAKEVAVRLAIGASPRRIVRQLLTESVLLAFLGGALGTLLATWGVTLLAKLVEADLATGADARVLGFTAGICLLTGILFGLVPALRAVHSSLAPALKEVAVSGSKSSSRWSWGKGLVTGQVALSLLVLFAAGLLVRSLRNLQTSDTGYRHEHLLLMGLDPVASGYDVPRTMGLGHEILDKFSVVPGVRAVTFSENGLFSGTESGDNIIVPGFTPPQDADRLSASDDVGPGYFRTLGIPLLLGREIGLQDTASSPRVAVVSQSFAKFYFHEQNPIGRKFSIDDDKRRDQPIEIIGVAADSKQNSLRQPAERRFYLAYLQESEGRALIMNVEISTAGDPAGVATDLRKQIQSIDPNLTIRRVHTMDELIDDSIGEQVVLAKLSGFFAALALVLACIGLYGIMSYTVAGRTREIGVRMALGAQRTDVLWLVLGEALVLVAVGIVVGVPAAIASSKLLSSMLFGLSATDPASLATVTLTLGLVAALASYIPARRATKVDPMVALRYE
jgi:predicted permease